VPLLGTPLGSTAEVPLLGTPLGGTAEVPLLGTRDACRRAAADGTLHLTPCEIS
jgi:hypothetical protein